MRKCKQCGNDEDYYKLIWPSGELWVFCSRDCLFEKFRRMIAFWDAGTRDTPVLTGTLTRDEWIERGSPFGLDNPDSPGGFFSEPFPPVEYADVVTIRSGSRDLRHESEPFVLTLCWVCSACKWSIVMNAPGFAGDGRYHYPDGRTPCGPLHAIRVFRSDG